MSSLEEKNPAAGTGKKSDMGGNGVEGKMPPSVIRIKGPSCEPS
jgi:hypothetical protein